MAADPHPGRVQLTIRGMLPSDVSQVSTILRGSPEAVFWSESSLKEVLGWQGVIALITETKGRITGFLVARQAADEAEILNLAVEEGNRRLGYGHMLIDSAEFQLRSVGVKRLFLEVRESNRVGTAFYEKHSFLKSGRRTRYYQEPVEDAIVMEKHLSA